MQNVNIYLREGHEHDVSIMVSIQSRKVPFCIQPKQDVSRIKFWYIWSICITN